MSRLLIVSFDAVASRVWEEIPDGCLNMAAFAESAESVTGVSSVFLSNTYPIHCSVITGKLPCDHGVMNNTSPFPEPHPMWTVSAAAIKSKTLWRAASEKGLKAAAFLWPCTSGSRHIRYNMPEIHPYLGQNQVVENLKGGSKLMQLSLYLRHRKKLADFTQPGIDDFTTSCAVDILKSKQPDLSLVHLLCCDFFGHEHGSEKEKLMQAYKSLDENLGKLLEAAGDDTSVIVFSDHACPDVHTEYTPNDLLVEMGLLDKEGELYKKGKDGCFFECCGGSVFFYPGTLDEEKINEVLEEAARLEGISRFLSDEELETSGRSGVPFGFGLKSGYSASSEPTGHKGNHGYPLDTPDYCVFYAVRGKGFTPGARRRGGSLLDIAPIAASILGIDNWED